MGLRAPLLDSLELLTRKAVPWAQGLSPPPLRSLLILWSPLTNSTATTCQVLYEGRKLLSAFVASLFTRSCSVGRTRGSCTGAFPQVSRKNLPFSDSCQKVAWRHEKDKVTSDKLWWDQHEPCLRRGVSLWDEGRAVTAIYCDFGKTCDSPPQYPSGLGMDRRMGLLCNVPCVQQDKSFISILSSIGY